MDSVAFRSLFEALPGACVAVAADPPRFTIVAHSAAMARAVGLPGDALVGRGLFEALPESAGSAGAANLRHCLERSLCDRVAGILGLERYDILRPGDGASRFVETWWAVAVAPVFAAAGAVDSLLVTFEDVTERRRCEEALRLSEATCRGIIEIAADAMISLDGTGRITFFNEGAERIFGWTRQEMIGATLDRLIPERFRARHRDDVARFAVGAVGARRMGERTVEICGVRRNGEEFAAEAAISKVAVDGRAVLSVALRDATETRRIEQEQRFLAEVGVVLGGSLDEEETLASIGRLVVRDLADCLIVDVLPESRLHRAVHLEPGSELKWIAGRAKAGEPGDARIVTRFAQLRIERHRPQIASVSLDEQRSLLVPDVTEAWLESVTQSAEHLELVRALEPRSIMTVPLLRRGRLLGALIFVSSRPGRRYDARDLALAEEVTRRAALAIDNARLYGEAQRALAARDLVLGVVAHDLRSPLAVIKLLASAGASTLDEGSPVSAHMARIRHAADRANRLIGDLLDVTRLEAGRSVVVERKPVAVDGLVASAIEELRPLVERASLTIDAVVDERLPDVFADRERLLQIFENLVGNAIKFTPPGGRITVAAERGEDGVRFRVADTGRGIPAEELPHLFERFRQSRPDPRGIGLGLPIVKAIVDAHKGSVAVESRPGVGTTFRFDIPQCPATASEPVSDEATHEPAAPSP